jgi:hypothetical protein
VWCVVMRRGVCGDEEVCVCVCLCVCVGDTTA